MGSINGDSKSGTPGGDKKVKSFKIKLSSVKDTTASSSALHGGGGGGSDHEGSVASSVKGVKPSKSTKTSKKRKAEDTMDLTSSTATNGGSSKKVPLKTAKAGAGEKKDTKKSKKQGEAKVKGPVDVEKQCGVPLPQGGLCARSLTCKSHSMGSKRAVTGRSQPYDILLAQYQKKNHAKLSMSKSSTFSSSSILDQTPSSGMGFGLGEGQR